MQKFKTMVLLAMALVLSACASTQRLSETDRTRLKTVTVSDSVQKGQLFLLAPGGANIGLMFGAVGGLAASGPLSTSQAAFGAFVDAHAVSIDAIVREEFEKVLRESGKVTVVAPGTTAVPVMSIAVPQYGFGVPHLLSSNVVAVMQIKCALTDSTGKVLWSESERILPSIASPMETTTWAQLRDNPKLIEEQWRKAAHFLAKKVVDTL
jgi:uncharacterized membrane protein